MESNEELMSMDFSDEIHSYFGGIKSVVDSLCIHQIQEVIEQMIEAYHNDRFIFVFGNGGSASTASHMMTDFNKGICGQLEKKMRMLCLNDNIPLMLAIANDIEYNQIFKFQLENYLRKDDLVIAISGSGNSINVLEAVKFANSQGATTIGFVGYDGGILKKIAKYSIHVPIHDMQQVEDMHLAIQHLMFRILTKHLNLDQTREIKLLETV